MAGRRTVGAGCRRGIEKTDNRLSVRGLGPNGKDGAIRLFGTSRQTEIQRRFLRDQFTPLFRTSRITIGQPQSFQEKMIPFPDRFLAALGTLALVVPEVGAGPAEIIDSFGCLQQNIVLPRDDVDNFMFGQPVLLPPFRKRDL